MHTVLMDLQSRGKEPLTATVKNIGTLFGSAAGRIQIVPTWKFPDLVWYFYGIATIFKYRISNYTIQVSGLLICTNVIMRKYWMQISLRQECQCRLPVPMPSILTFVQTF